MKKERTEQARFLRRCLFYHLGAGGGALLFLALELLGAADFLFFCPTHTLLSLYCPLCGGTRAVLALLRGEVATALSLNPFFFFMLAVLFYYESFALLAIHRRRPALFRKSGVWPLWVTLAAALLFFLVRNLLLYTVGYDPIGDFTAH